ncbi:hypothetical protein LZ31DRAFT_620525 [Colletotrichum somersetense]|nr:hypothetical protein LZ31DRAFT_620525 [Colletotrichum somersetense]
MAASAGHSGEPLFNGRDVRPMTPCIIPGADSGNMSTNGQGQGEIDEEGPWFEQLGAEPLYRRGWCPYGISREVHPSNSSADLSSGFSDPRMIPSKFTPETCFETWRLIVNAYAKTNLSFATETFYALAGLAERIKQLSESKYLHGLWEADLAKCLAWWDETHERRYGFDAPSTLGPQGPIFSVSTGPLGRPLDADMVQQEIMRRVEGVADRCDAVAQFDGPETEREEKSVPGNLLCVLLTSSHCRPEYMGVLLASVSVSNTKELYRRIGFFQLDSSYNGAPSHVETNVGWAPEITKRGREFLNECYGRLLQTLESQSKDPSGLPCDGTTDERTTFLI